jgi:hypothetical protein
MIYTYSAHCSSAADWERICSLAEYERNPVFCCPDCGTPLDRTYHPFRLHTSNFDAFVSPVDGRVIHNKRELAEHNLRNNCVSLHDGYDEKGLQDFTKRKWGVEPDKEELKRDMKEAVEKLEQGYKPILAPETDDLE